ncbi:hypothetical protein EYF80_001637 [Liparis tanakae]|uniref:Uncharacterized protein n=1 Tax=Liparis tanakae TaxID=230148 RepID=A0A4Z2JCW0_9TELE|nr:hypothetical protein EYF80_001637 [Liparis tanakae]
MMRWRELRRQSRNRNPGHKEQKLSGSPVCVQGNQATQRHETTASMRMDLDPAEGKPASAQTFRIGEVKRSVVTRSLNKNSLLRSPFSFPCSTDGV